MPLTKPSIMFKFDTHYTMPRLLQKVIVFSALCLFPASAFAQPVVDSIKYEEPDQSVIIVYLSEDVTYTATSPLPSPDWVVYHGGTAYASVATAPRGGFDAN